MSTDIYESKYAECVDRIAILTRQLEASKEREHEYRKMYFEAVERLDKILDIVTDDLLVEHISKKKMVKIIRRLVS